MHPQRLREPSLFFMLVFFYLGIGFATAFSSLGSSSSNKRFGLGRVINRKIEVQVSQRRKTELSIFWRNDENAVSEDSTTESDPVFFNNIFGKSDAVSKDVNVEKNGHMVDLVQFLRNEPDKAIVVEEPVEEENSLGGIIAIGGIAAAVALTLSLGVSIDGAEIVVRIQNFFGDPAASLEAVVSTVQEMGPLGYLYFGAVYTAAEILAIPAIPLTASAGYLFGVRDGTAVVLLSASIAAAVSFIIGRTFLRDYVEKALDDYPDFKKIDKAIGEEGFKLMLLLRLSPVFPFALSNYLYGVTSIKFWPYFWGTMIGFTPGTIAYVYTGEIGKSLTLGSASAEPWYVYAGALALISGFIKFAGDTATGIIEKVQEDEENM